jgi:RHS repeat-associated protein
MPSRPETLHSRRALPVCDEETSLCYNYFRDYDPQTGRYVQSDPIGLRGGLNTYLYVEARPLNYSDPFGLDRTIWSSGTGRSMSEGPRNGNWCGGNWSGGQVPSLHGGREGPHGPVDSLDGCCMVHDRCYERCEKVQEKNARKACMITECDRVLVKCLSDLDNDCTRWPERPRAGTEGDSQTFRDDAMRYFNEEVRKWERQTGRRP